MANEVPRLEPDEQGARAGATATRLPLLHATTVFVSAFLLFSVQLIVAKFFIVWFGGSSSAWITAMLFFQALLLLGYAYSHWLTTRLRPSRQAQTHSVVLLFAGSLLVAQQVLWGRFLLPDASWQPLSSSFPIPKLLGLLALSVGSVFFVAATTTSLMQAWFARAYPGRSPYPLYATSNIGSLLALLLYPLAVEPFIGLRVQAMAWGCLYFVLIVLCLIAGRFAVRSADPGPNAADPEIPPETQRLGPSGALSWWLWLMRACCGSVLFLATTQWLTQEIGSMPLLWSLPLALYLLSFYVTFRGGGYSRRIWIPLAIFCAVGASFVHLRGMNTGSRWFELARVFLPLAACLTTCVSCHGELHRLRPAHARLTAYNLTIAVGGVLGGILVAVLSPVLFNSIAEFPIGFVAAAVLVAVCLERDWRRSATGSRLILVRRVLSLLVIAGLIGALSYQPDTRRVATWRNFYGTSVVRKTEIKANDATCDFFELYHGRVRHGTQVGEPYRRLPTAYYGEKTGLGYIIRHLQQRKVGTQKVGAIGLGAGTVATYAIKGDEYRFYEIDDRMIQIAQGESGYFTYLKDSAAEVTVVPGDGRTSLEQELRAGTAHGFDLLILDAFSGDSPPTHLATKEAFELYLKHLADDGIILVNISNRFFDFRRSYEALTRNLGLAMRGYFSPDDGGVTYSAVWLVIAKDQSTLNGLDPSIPLKRIPAVSDGFRVWTDDRNSLLPLLRLF